MTTRRTAILISHRLSTVKMADRIFVVDQGQIVEQGTHDDLMAQEGLYNNLFLTQASTTSNSDIAQLIPYFSGHCYLTAPDLLVSRFRGGPIGSKFFNNGTFSFFTHYDIGIIRITRAQTSCKDLAVRCKGPALQSPKRWEWSAPFNGVEPKPQSQYQGWVQQPEFRSAAGRLR